MPRPWLTLVLLATVAACSRASRPDPSGPGAVVEAPSSPAAAPATGPSDGSAAAAPAAPAAPPSGELLECSQQSRITQACPDLFLPVCAAMDTGVRCIRAPCPEATRYQNFSSACRACKDQKTLGYYRGRCPD